MVKMELWLEKLKKIDDEKNTVDLAEHDGRLFAYTVHVNDHRIFTLFSFSHSITSRWTRDILRCFRKSEKVMVGVKVDTHVRYRCKDLKYHTYELMTVCMGSQCLFVELPNPWDTPDAELPLFPFFANPRVVAVGMNMKSVADNLFKDYEMKFSNMVDLREMAEEVLEDSHLYDFKKYDLDKLATAVLGKSWYVDRPKKLNWYTEKYRCWGELAPKKTIYSTYDAYLCYSIGGKLMEMKSEKRGGSLAVKKSNKKKGGTN